MTHLICGLLYGGVTPNLLATQQKTSWSDSLPFCPPKAPEGASRVKIIRPMMVWRQITLDPYRKCSLAGSTQLLLFKPADREVLIVTLWYLVFAIVLDAI